MGLLVCLTLSGGELFAQRPLGTDVSGYQPVVSWMFARTGGVSFAWAKATEGTGYVNPEYAEQIAGAKAVGIYIGSYHFARPSSHTNLTGANSAESEAQFFWSVASNYVKAGGQYMMPMLDWEDVNMTNQLSAPTLSAWVNQWCHSVSNYALANGVSGVRPVVYTGVWYSAPSSTYSGLTTAVTGWPAWIAAYPSNPNPQTGGPSSSYPWSTWIFWQYADTNWTGGDADVFNGTAAGLSAHIVGGLGRPYFASEPSNRYADQGGSITLRTVANGAAPLKYQWRFNGASIVNATNPAFTLSNLANSNGGDYTVIVTNSFGSITSRVAALTVNGFFIPVFSDNFDVNTSANWLQNQSSADSRITFAYDYAGLGIPPAPRSAGGSTKGVRFEANVSAGAVGACNISPVGQSFSGNYRLHYDLWINQNGPFPAGGTGSTQHHTSGIGTAGNRVQWNSGTADGVWFATDGEGQATDTSAALPDWRAYVGTTLQAAGSGVYVGGTESNIRGNGHPYYQNVFPGGQTAPAAQGQSGGLEGGTIGFGWRDVIVNKSGNVIEWFVDGLKIASVTNSLSAGNLFIGYWDSFVSLSSNTNLSFGLVDNVRVEIPAVAPTISVQPLAIAVKVTSNAPFNITATGTPAPAYQWLFNGTNLAGATTASYTRTNVQYSQAGNYSVLVSNLAGFVVSSNALLTILPAAPAAFQLAALQPDGSLDLTLSGDAGATYFVETSTNLVDWSALTNVSLSGPIIQFNVGPATSEPQRYFRARSAP
jgi:GH25 family lysozyme M1 (1,4-beta-N-acetylmuramidase)